ncbi:haloacid dehalogenase-like hydrolase [Vacuolonema iberomarrocanum]|uniref:haloacid dehalogenase-like hydrolase n=1 Tax=Vacuolonema iberomarrocanum TaxID=3454632 RepID=UPI003F6DB09F
MAMVFDFDDTLAPDTLDGLLTYLDIDVQDFRQQRVRPLLEEGWDKAAARCYCLVQESQRRSPDNKITREALAAFGQQIQPFPGVEGLCDRLRQRLHEMNHDIELEFYIITGGFVDIIGHTAVAPSFKRIWGCEFAYNEQDEIVFLKRSMSHTEKTRYLLQVSSGQEQVNKDGYAFAYRDIPERELYIPLSQVVYVGDGTSDVPCFSLVHDGRGIAIGVYKGDEPDEWGHEVQVSRSQRVSNLAAANYQDDSEMMRSLYLAVEAICKQIELRQLSARE